MHRIPRPENPRLEKLMDERDHLRIRISLIPDDDIEKPDKMRAYLAQVREIDREIERFEMNARQNRN